MFKSSIEGQSKMKSSFTFSQMTFQTNFSKENPKKLEFHRNTSAVNVPVKPEPTKKAEESK